MTTYVTTARTVSLDFIKNFKAELVEHLPDHCQQIAIARKGFGWPRAILVKKDGKYYKAITKDKQCHSCLFY